MRNLCLLSFSSLFTHTLFCTPKYLRSNRSGSTCYACATSMADLEPDRLAHPLPSASASVRDTQLNARAGQHFPRRRRRARGGLRSAARNNKCRLCLRTVPHRSVTPKHGKPDGTGQSLALPSRTSHYTTFHGRQLQKLFVLDSGLTS